MQQLCIIALQLVVFWRAWWWCLSRISASPAEGVALLLLIAAFALACVRNIVRRGEVHSISWTYSALFFIAYGLAYSIALPAILRCGIASLALFLSVYQASFGRNPTPVASVIALMVLPIVPSLQFYLGYPARIISASLSVVLLQLNGMNVQRQGTFLVWHNQLIQFDAPCSGVTMLWAATLLCLLMALWYRFNTWQTLVTLILGGVLVLMGNVIRATSLFYLETNLLQFNQPWLHETIGLVAFAFTAALIIVLTSRFKQWLT